MTGYLVKRADTPEDRAALFAVRIEVFVVEQQVPEEEELDAYDETAVHFLALSSEGRAVGAARLLEKAEGTGKVGRVAVLKEHRGKGVGAEIMRFVERTAQESGFQKLELDAQLHAIPFYERLGYTAEGEVFLDAGIEHRKMKKFLL